MEIVRELPLDQVLLGDCVTLMRMLPAASIIAKVVRDRGMARLDRRWPGYGWASNAGYSTKLHLDALAGLGPTPHHRMGFAPLLTYAQLSSAGSTKFPPGDS